MRRRARRIWSMQLFGHRPGLYEVSTRRVLDLIADKWTALIVGLLAERPHLFGELRSAIEGISAKVLAQKLRLLESDGLVDRRVLPTRRVTVEYSLTPLGHTLTAPLEAIRDWAERHIEEVRQANLRSGPPSGNRRTRRNDLVTPQVAILGRGNLGGALAEGLAEAWASTSRRPPWRPATRAGFRAVIGVFVRAVSSEA